MGFVFFLDQEFVIAKNRLFVLPCNKDAPELLGIIKVNSSTALMLDFKFPDGPFADKNVYHPWCTAEIQNGLQQQKIIVITILRHNIQNIKVVSCIHLTRKMLSTNLD